MTATDLTRKKNFSQKKTISVAAARVSHDMAAAVALELFNLPANCVIKESYVVVETAGQGGLTVDFGYDGGSELANDLDIASTGVKTPTLAATTALTSGAATIALTSGALTGTLTDLTGDVDALTLNEGTPNTLNSGTVALTSGALTGTVTTLTGTGTVTTLTGTGTVTKAPLLNTGTGKTITAKFSADPTAGVFVFVVEYIEFDLANGQLMNLGDGDTA